MAGCLAVLVISVANRGVSQEGRSAGAHGSGEATAAATQLLQQRFRAADFTLENGNRLEGGALEENVDANVQVTIAAADDYTVRVAVEAIGETPVSMTLKADGSPAHRFDAPAGDPTPETTTIRLEKGVHTLTLRGSGGAARISFLELMRKGRPASGAKRRAHAQISTF